MLQINVSTGKGMNKNTGVVQVYGFSKFSPRAARAALEIAGFYTGTATYTEPGYIFPTAYRVYANTARKLNVCMY